MRLWAVIACMGLVFLPSIATGATAQAVVQNGPSENRIDIVVLAEGYTSAQSGKALSDLTGFIDGIEDWQPFITFDVHFNWWLVPLVSSQSGADHPSRNTYVDTALDATYDYYNIERLLVVDQQKAVQEASAAFPAYDYIMVMVNDPMYGGSGGEIAVFSVHEAAPMIAVHEFGHTHGGLADEYEDAYPGFPAGDWEPNVTYATARENIPWTTWIASGTPVPTPETYQYQSVVGLFEGARYLTSGIYRPKYTCMMRELGVAFCEVCNETMILEDYRYVRTYDAFEPAQTNVILYAGEHKTFSIQPLQPSGTPTVSVTWLIDDISTGGESDSLLVGQEDFSQAATHSVKAIVTDETSFIRHDPDALATYAVVWTVTLSDIPVDGDVDEDIDPEPEADPEIDTVDTVDDVDALDPDAIDDVVDGDAEDVVDTVDSTDSIDSDNADEITDSPGDSDVIVEEELPPVDGDDINDIDAADVPDTDTYDSIDRAETADRTDAGTGNSSSGGCALGFGWEWLLAAVYAALRLRKRHRPW